MIQNNANPVEEIVNVNRAQIEHRATWMGLIYDEMVKAGIDAEPIVRRAIKRCGLMHGANFKKMCQNPSSCVDFKNAFLGDETKVPDIEILGANQYVNRLTFASQESYPDPRPALRQNQTPSLIMRGVCEFLPWEVAYEYKQTLPNATLLSIPRAVL